MLCIALHNMGAELEFLGKRSEALETYERGLANAQRWLRPGNPIVRNLAETCRDARTKAAKSDRYRETREVERVRKTVRFIRSSNGIGGRVDLGVISQIKSDCGYGNETRARSSNGKFATHRPGRRSFYRSNNVSVDCGGDMDASSMFRSLQPGEEAARPQSQLFASLSSDSEARNMRSHIARMVLFHI